ncbi:hypothetical protein [Sphingomonas sp. RS2018]
MPNLFARLVCVAALGVTSACSGAPDDADANAVAQNVSLRNLTETVGTPVKAAAQDQGDLIPTPSDKDGRHYLLRQRTPLTGDTIFGNLREERGGKVAYSRIELSCEKRQFRIVSVGQRRTTVEFKKNGDGPLRPIDGLPLREDIAAFVCERAGTPLAKGAG